MARPVFALQVFTQPWPGIRLIRRPREPLQILEWPSFGDFGAVPGEIQRAIYYHSLGAGVIGTLNL
jgi:hypothetical protein